MDLDYFQLIDRIVDLNIEARTIRVEARVPEKHTIFEGISPGFPIMPGVLLTEAMAQSSGWLILAVMKFQRMPFLAKIEQSKMRGFVTPGQVLTIDATLDYEGEVYAATKAKVMAGSELRCNAELRFGHVPFPDPKLRVHMDAMANKIGFPLQAITQ